MSKIEIKKLDINGHGIGYINKKIAFVKNALPGELVHVKEVKEYPKYIEAVVESYLKKSKDRVQPKCPVYSTCGGCDLMHLNYQKQLEFKRDIVLDAIQKYVKLPITVNPTIGMKHPFNYRNKAQLRVKKANKVVLGLFEEASHFVIDLERCPVHETRLNELITKIRVALEESNISLGKGGIEGIMVRVNDTEDTVVFVSKRALKLRGLVHKLKEIPNISIFESVQKGRQFLGETKLLHGSETQLRTLKDKTYSVRPTDFFQLNDEQTIKLYDHVKSLIQESDTILDLYMGVGTIGQYIVQNQKLRGIESVASAVTSARENAKRNGLDAHYEVGTVQAVLTKWAKKGYRPDVVIFDPPRTGMSESLESILKMRPKQLIYISCNPSTLAKDLNELKKHYHIGDIQPFDMFPQTSHVETCVRLILKDQ